jgi:DNA-binding MarR family transcriptional regulator
MQAYQDDASDQPGVQDPSLRIGFLLWHLGQAIRVRGERAVAPLDLTLTQLQGLIVLSLNPGLSSAELARRCAVTAPSMGKAVDALTERGLVEPSPPVHGRIIELRATPAGVAMAIRGQAILEPIEQDALERFSLEEQRELKDLLLRLIMKLTPQALLSTSWRPEQ